jgi:hypothetical protein
VSPEQYPGCIRGAGPLFVVADWDKSGSNSESAHGVARAPSRAGLSGAGQRTRCSDGCFRAFVHSIRCPRSITQWYPAHPTSVAQCSRGAHLLVIPRAPSSGSRDYECVGILLLGVLSQPVPDPAEVWKKTCIPGARRDSLQLFLGEAAQGPHS